MLGKTLPLSYSPLLTFAFTEGLIEFPGKVLNLTWPPEYWDTGLYNHIQGSHHCVDGTFHGSPPLQSLT